jgi:glycolate oxidase
MSALAAQLRAILPAEIVHDDEEIRHAHAGDKWHRGDSPDVVVAPHTVEQVSALLAWANENGVPVTPRGSGYGYVGGSVTSRQGILLSLLEMNRIREINAPDFVALVEPGVTTESLQMAVRELGLFYPPDPSSRKYSSIGGNIATNAGGPRSLKYGVTRHYVLGLEVVLADGRVLHLGGRTHKNKTGFDLLGLFVGSEGMLGVVTAATLRLLPHPPVRAGLAAVFPAPEMAAAAVEAILAEGILPAALELADGFTWQSYLQLEGLPPDEAGAYLLVELDGQPEAVAVETEDIAAILRRCGAVSVEQAMDDAGAEALWAVRRRFSAALDAACSWRLNEDIVVPRSRLVDLMHFGRELGERHGLRVACFGHAGDGNVHVNILVNESSDLHAAHQEAETALDELFAQILDWGGAITGEHGIGLAKKRWWPEAASPEVRAAHAAVKAALDPKGILNPGKFL